MFRKILCFLNLFHHWEECDYDPLLLMTKKSFSVPVEYYRCKFCGTGVWIHKSEEE